MAQYTTIQQVINTIKEKYQDISKLSKMPLGNGCFYNHNKNGVGCAIGCLLTPSNAQQLDDTFSNYIENIYYIYKDKNNIHINEYDLLKTIFEDVFDMNNITIFELNTIQKCHDNSDTVEEFLLKLDTL